MFYFFINELCYILHNIGIKYQPQTDATENVSPLRTTFFSVPTIQ
jgi:hypothetical protein